MMWKKARVRVRFGGNRIRTRVGRSRSGQYGLAGLTAPAPLTAGEIGALVGFPLPFGSTGLGSTGFPFGSIGLGISFGGLPVPGTGVVVTGVVVTGWAPAGSGAAHPSRCVAPQVSQAGPHDFFFPPHRDFIVSNRFGREELFPHGSHGAAHGGGHGVGHGGGHGGGAHPQSFDFFPNFDFRRSSRPGLEHPQSE